MCIRDRLMNILHVMYLYNKIKENPSMDFYPRTFIFGAKAAAGYKMTSTANDTYLSLIHI